MLGADREPVAIDQMLLPPEAWGVRCISIGYFVPEGQAVIWRGPMLHKALEQFLTDVYWDDPDFLLVDMPPGTGDIAISLSQYLPRGEVYVVTTPQPAAQKVARLSAAMAAKVNLPVRGVIENMSWFTGDDGKRYEIFGVRRRRRAGRRARRAAAGPAAARAGAAAGGDDGPADRRRRPRQRDRPGVPRPRRAHRRRAAAEEGLQPRAEARLSATVDPLPRYRFERLVAEALDDLPDELAGVLDNVVVQVEDRNPDEPDLLGLYDGVPHTERTGQEGPDVVSIYRLALCEMCDDEDDLAEEVYVTVIHELAHAAGIDDDRLHELGWA